jgi:elongator complex protein 2
LQETCSLVKLTTCTLLATAGVDSKIHVYLEVSNQFLFQASLEGHIRNIRSLDFKRSQEGSFLASAGQDCLVRVWRFSSDLPSSSVFGQGVYELEGLKCRLDAVISGHSNLVSSVQWVGEEILTCSHDFSVILWYEESSTCTWMAKATLGQIGGNKNVFLGAVAQADRILAYTYNGGFYHWVQGVEGWSSLIAPTGHNNEITDLVVCESYVLTSSLDQTCRLWTFNNFWLESSRPMVHGYDINSISISKGKLISGADEKILRVFDPSASTSEILESQGLLFEGKFRGSSQVLGLTTKSTSEVDFDFKSVKITEDLLNSYTLWPESYKLYGHGYEICATDACGEIVASACKSRTKEHSAVFIWNIESKSKVQSLEFHTLGVTALAFSPDGEKLVTGSRDLFWCLYFKVEGKFEIKKNNKAHGRVVYTCSWNQDSSLFVTGSRDKKVKVWNLDGEMVACIGFDAGVTASAWIDGLVVVVGLDNGEISLNRLENLERFEKVFVGGVVNKLKVLGDRVFCISADHTFRVFRLV